MLLVVLSLFLLTSLVAAVFSVNALINTLRFGLPFVTTPQWAIDWLIDNLNLKSSDRVYELGHGDVRRLLFDHGPCLGDWTDYFSLDKKLFHHERLIGRVFMAVFTASPWLVVPRGRGVPLAWPRNQR